MRTIIVSSSLFITVVTSFCIGILSAYAAIQAVLHVFARQPNETPEPAPALLGQEATVEQ